MVWGRRLVGEGCGGPGEGERFNWACTDWNGDFEGGECVDEQLSSATSMYGRTVISMMDAARRTAVKNVVGFIHPVIASLSK
jgi:hypothetical protein